MSAEINSSNPFVQDVMAQEGMSKEELEQHLKPFFAAGDAKQSTEVGKQVLSYTAILVLGAAVTAGVHEIISSVT